MQQVKDKSKQRVFDALSSKTPDRTPIGFFAIDSDTASKVLGRKTFWRAKAECKKAFWDGRRDEVVQSWIEDGIELYRKLDIIDIVPVYSSMSAGICPPKNYQPEPPRQLDRNTWEDKLGRIYKYSPQTKDITIVYHPKAAAYKDIEQEKWNGSIEKPDETIFEAVDTIINAFKEDRFVIGNHAGEMAWLLGSSMEQGFMEIALNPDKVKSTFESQIEKAIAHDEFYIRPGQDATIGGEDLACSKGPFINPDTYKRLFLPGFKKRITSLQNKKLPFIKHCCGDTTKFLDIFVEAGIDCYQSVQASAGMDITQVYEKYSNQFALWGGVPVEHLIEGDAFDIRSDVRKVMQKLGSRSKFILGTSHSVAVGTKYDNFLAMLDEFSKWI
jgi:uroporphyrinogen-III decarboxylase